MGTLKTIVGETDDPPKAAIPSEAIKHFYATKTPFSTWKIWIGQYQGATWSTGTRYIHVGASSRVPHVSKSGIISSRLQKLQTSTFFIGQLCIHIFSSTGNIQYRLRGRKASLLQEISTPTGRDIRWPLALMMNDEDAGLLSYGLAAVKQN